MIFRYADGREVEPGDHLCVRWGDHGFIPAIVEDVILPGTQKAADYSCVETGGVFLKDVGGKAFGLMLDPGTDGRLDEDCELVRRGKATD